MLLWSCAGVPSLRPGAEKIAVLDGATPGGVRLTVLKVVHGRGCGLLGLLGRRDGAEAQMRNAALDAGADYVTVTHRRAPYSDGQCRHNEYILEGVAYKSGAAGATSGGIAVGSSSSRVPLPAPAPGSHGLGRVAAVDGCLAGHIYAVQDGSRVPDEYGSDAPASQLWGCSWNVDLRDGSPGFSGAQPGGWYVVRHQGAFAVPSAGEYVFMLAGRYPWRLTIDGKAFVGTATQPARVSLSAGEHAILLEYLYLGGRAFALDLRVVRPGGSAVPFSLERGSPYFALQSVRYGGAQALGDGWRRLASMDEDEIRILEQVHFETASAEIRKDDRSEAVLFAVAKILSEHSELKRVEVQGHTDDQGTDSFNLELSQRRAEAVRKWLMEAGIAPHRLSARGYGKTRPLAGNASDAGRATNRRVQFVLEGATSGEQPLATPAKPETRDTDLRVMIADAIIAPSDALADLLPAAIGRHRRVDLETRLHLRGLSAAAIYRGPDDEEALVVLASAIDPVLIRAKFPREVAGYPASEAEAPLLLLSERTALLVTTLRGPALSDFVNALQPARLRKLAEQRVAALPKTKAR